MEDQLSGSQDSFVIVDNNEHMDTCDAEMQETAVHDIQNVNSQPVLDVKIDGEETVETQEEKPKGKKSTKMAKAEKTGDASDVGKPHRSKSNKEKSSNGEKPNTSDSVEKEQNESESPDGFQAAVEALTARRIAIVNSITNPTPVRRTKWRPVSVRETLWRQQLGRQVAEAQAREAAQANPQPSAQAQNRPGTQIQRVQMQNQPTADVQNQPVVQVQHEVRFGERTMEKLIRLNLLPSRKEDLRQRFHRAGLSAERFWRELRHMYMTKIGTLCSGINYHSFHVISTLHQLIDHIGDEILLLDSMPDLIGYFGTMVVLRGLLDETPEERRAAYNFEWGQVVDEHVDEFRTMLECIRDYRTAKGVQRPIRSIEYYKQCFLTPRTSAEAALIAQAASQPEASGSTS
ncbi:hypothetical protein QR680_002259 [Steinernema hermaphroditum]|uniref:Uncharacterized protein n=1 Tax=Steinernema hermaphroditum TaxID=289476 RepID=A0AA39H2X1_9BILA|nr:hypothetical protein QR680_002259 [Steinernema hermaphroditum]